MNRFDLLLIHPPATFRNPSNLRLHSMIAASVPSTAAFEMYPLGFLSIGEYLERKGYSVSICNLALLPTLFPKIRVESIIRGLFGRVVGIDLQWAVHTDGVLEAAGMVKKHHPQSRIVLGGFTASYFWKELMDYPQVDFVIRGDSAEYPLLCLLQTLKEKGNLEEVPNLVWRDETGTIRTTGVEWVPQNIDDYRTDYSWLVRSSVRNPFGPLLSIPYRDWFSNPSAAVLTQRGCPINCAMCGGSAAAYRKIFKRENVAIKSPPSVIRDVKSATRILRSRIFLGSDLQFGGREYYGEIFDRFESLRVENPLTIEVITPGSLDFFERAVKGSSSVTLQISAESHDEELRRNFGRDFSNGNLEQMIEDALKIGIKAIRIFFAIGLPHQTPQSVMETIQYCGSLLERFGKNKRLYPFISILAPFLEPASVVFEDPSRYGCTNFFETLEGYRKAIRKDTWKETLGYETRQMDRGTLVEVTYTAGIEMNRLLEKYHLISSRERFAEEERLKKERDLVRGEKRSHSQRMVGESSLYTPNIRGFLFKPFAFRPVGVFREVCKGILL